VDSVHSHANWAAGLGGISFPLLADFHPKGAVAASFGLYLEDRGITDRATVIIDADGIVRHISSVTPAGSRDIAELAALSEQVNRDYAGTLPAVAAPPAMQASMLFVKSNCGFSRAALLARTNLHLEQQVAVKNVSEDPTAMAELTKLSGKEQAPALLLGDELVLESADIVKKLVAAATGG
jgi:glutaredoxin-related protein